MGINSESVGARRRTWRRSGGGGGGNGQSHAVGSSDSIAPPPPPPPPSVSSVVATAAAAALQDQQQQQSSPPPQPQPGLEVNTTSTTSTKQAPCPTDATTAARRSPGDEDGSNAAKYRRLREHIAEMRDSGDPSGAGVDQVGRMYSRYAKMREECSALCRALLNAYLRRNSSNSALPSTATGSSSVVAAAAAASDATEAPRSPGIPSRGRCGHDLLWNPEAESHGPAVAPPPSSKTTTATTTTTSSSGKTRLRDQYLDAVRDWQGCQEALLDAIRASLLETYQEADPAATVRSFEMLCSNQNARKIAIKHYESADGMSREQRELRLVLFSDLPIPSPDTIRSGFLTGYEIRFGNYDLIQGDLGETRRLLDAAESGVSPGAPVQECVISPRGDAVLEFANAHVAAADAPIYRFRVSSHMLAEVSPVFARVFSLYRPVDARSSGGMASSGGSTVAARPSPVTASMATSIEGGSGYERVQLPPPPTSHTCSDGTEAMLYEMPQTELNTKQAMEIVLHAAHLHHEMVPRDVEFDQFVAIAEVCLRYRCTSPLEPIVEHRWLPQWMHRTLGAGEFPDGLLLISYAFGARRLFTRVSKSAILNVVDEADLRAKPWPRVVKDKIWAVRQAKIDQVYACCGNALQEYLRPPPPPPPPSPPQPPISTPLVSDPASSSSSSNTKDVQNPKITKNKRNSRHKSEGETPGAGKGTGIDANNGNSNSDGAGIGGNARACVFEPTSTSRCPKGSHTCDAYSLGWLMKTFAELQVLPRIMQSTSMVGHLPPPSRRSLNQLFDSLRFMGSPPPNDGHHDDDSYHGGLCDYATAFRSAINDVYNSVPGLTLYDVAGRHGWGISRHKHDQPQAKNRMKVMYYYHTRHKGSDAIRAARASVELRILSLLDDLGDLHAAAMVNRSFYDTYKKNELVLMRGILKREAMRRRSDTSTLISAPSRTRGAAGGSGGHWRKSLGYPPQQYRQQQQQQQYQRQQSIEGSLSISKSSGLKISVPEREKQETRAAPSNVPVSYFEVSDEEDDDIDQNNDTSEYEDGDPEVGGYGEMTAKEDRHQSVESAPGVMTPTTAEDDDDSRTDSNMMMTREEAEQILWPPRNSDMPPSPPSYTFTSSLEMATTVAAQESHQIPREHENQRYQEQWHQRRSTPAGPGSREKFLSDDGLVPTEHKTLLPSENKHLRETYNRLVGLHADSSPCLYEGILDSYDFVPS